MALAGDRDRERRALEVRRHYLAGRLTEAELADRLELALGARTVRDARRATKQLPPWWLEVDELVPSLRAGVERLRHAVLVAVVGLVWLMMTTAVLVAFVAWIGANGPSAAALIGFPLCWLALSALLYRRTSVSRRRLPHPQRQP